MKYPRTYHVPWSPGATNDDKKLSQGWFKNFSGVPIVITEKLDGENTGMTKQDVYARSHGAPTRSPWSRNLWDPGDGLYWRVRDLIGPTETLFGENLYGVHSITYNRLPDYWYLFSATDGEWWYSWDEVLEFSRILGVKTVPTLFRGVIGTEEELKKVVLDLVSSPSTFGDTKEGVVIRVADEFSIDEFKDKVCKYVRENHVQTDTHWTKKWKKAELILPSNIH